MSSERLIQRFSEKDYLVFSRGKFDFYLVKLYLNGKVTSPTDIDCFYEVLQLAKEFGNSKVYDDLKLIYDNTGKEVDTAILEKIKEMAQTYGQRSYRAWIVFTVIYATMIAEENKQYTKIGKKIKLLGFYQVLQLNFSSVDASNFSRGKGWRDLLDLIENVYKIV